MANFVFAMIGMAMGALCVFLILEKKRRQLAETEQEQSRRRENIEEANVELQRRRQELDGFAVKLQGARAELENKHITYGELRSENGMLKRDLKNLELEVRKLSLDTQQTQENQHDLNQRVDDIGARYLNENVKWIGLSLNPNNFANCKRRLSDVIERCRNIGFEIPKAQEDALIADLKNEYEKVVRAAFEREHQARIRAQIREEQKVNREIEREMKRVEQEKSAIEAALKKALAESADEHSVEIEHLRTLLAEAESKERAISQAQLTKAGHVYVISNVGSYGENVFKIGMTRRLEPLDRVRELGDASVPFPFDVHMMISCEDAPKLENALHKEFHSLRLNKTNPRKEFFRVNIETIRQIVERDHGEVEYVADAEALQYRQSLEMTDDDEEFIESVYDRITEDGDEYADV